jgi:hypothetical protein
MPFLTVLEILDNYLEMLVFGGRSRAVLSPPSRLPADNYLESTSNSISFSFWIEYSLDISLIDSKSDLSTSYSMF